MTGRTSAAERRRVVVTGRGLLSPLGDSPAAFLRALCAGESGIGPFSLAGRGLPASAALPARAAGQIDLEPRSYLEAGNLRPLDRTSQLVTIAAQLALEDAGWRKDERGSEALGLVLGTMFCSIRTIASFDRRAVEAGPQYAKPFDFANSVINAAAGQAAIWHGLSGINSTLAGGPAASLLALGYATEMIRAGRARALLAGGVEELCLESFYGLSRTGLLCRDQDSAAQGGGEASGCAVPLDARRDGCRLGEGAAFLVLEEATAAERRGARILAEVRGHANAFDPSRGRECQAATDAVARTVRLTMDDAGLEAGSIDALSLSASGCIEGDRHEARGIGWGLGETAGRIPVTAVKSMLGETLGAAGAFQTLTLLEAMHQGRWPGIRGLEQLEDGLPLAQASVESREIDLRHGLAHAQGFDGNCAALIIERREAA